MDHLAVLVAELNGLLWGYVLVFVLLAAGVIFAVRLGGLQFVRIGEILRTVAQPAQADAAGISPFQALCTSLAARIGTGNVAGVAVAIYLGGPGSVFWMWLVALLGMATAFAESSLAQAYKVRDATGRYRGGPAFYIANGLGSGAAAVAFSICLIIAFGLVFNAVQANSIAEAMVGAFGAPPLWTGLVITVCAGLVVSGGVKGIARFAELVVPVMACAYLLLALVAVVMNASAVPAMLRLIVSSAFGLDQAAGGMVGGVMAALLNGVKRGLFSNEAGMGSAPNIAATAAPNPHHPCSQGFVQAFGVFVDTLLVCTATALLILLSGKAAPGSGLTGIQLTQQAMSVHFGAWGPGFVALAILFFAFTSIAGNYAYAEGALVYLGLDRPLGLWSLRLLLLAIVLWGAVSPVMTVFDLADLAMGVMTLINVAAILLLSGLVVRLTRDYLGQRDAGRDPEFDPAAFPELVGRIDMDIWKRRPAESKVTSPAAIPSRARIGAQSEHGA